MNIHVSGYWQNIKYHVSEYSDKQAMLIGAPSHNMTWFLYLLECNNGTYYAGITNDLQARFDVHLSGKGARYTRANPPIQILASRCYADRSSASVAEAQLKRLPRYKKLGFFDG